MSDPILDVQDLCVRIAVPGKRGESVEVVRKVSFQLSRGEVCGLLGATGCGKTVLVRTILGISSARPGRVSGDAWLLPEGADKPLSVFDSNSAKLRPGWAGYIFQDPVAALDPLRIVLDQVQDSVAVRHPRLAAAERRKRALEWLQQVRLADPERVGQMYPFELSGGMAQRVCAAVALATEPELLVADEPTSGLDWSLRREMVELLGEQCRERGMTLLLISHDIQVIRHLAEHVLVMEAGEITQRGLCGEVFPEPDSNSYTGELQVWADTLDDESALVPRRVDHPSKPRGRRLLCAQGLSHSFPGAMPGDEPVHAVKDVDLDVHAGEFLGLVGESGSGKTTLGKLLLWVLAAEDGQVRFDGEELGELDRDALRALRGRMQISYQQPSAALNPGMSVAEHLAETIGLHRPQDMARCEQLTDETLSTFQLQGKEASRPAQLSGGERRRVSIARCLLPKPDLLVLDEPTAGLDAAVKGQVIDVLRETRAEGSAYLLISHELDLLQRVADRIAVMFAGRIVEEMPASFLDPEHGGGDLHPYTQQLLSASFRSPRRIAAPCHPTTEPGGCVFRSRCHRVEPGTELWQQCTRDEPQLVPLGSGEQKIACHLVAQQSALES